MNGLRAKISPKLADDGSLIHLKVEWVEVVDNQIVGEPKAVEEFQISSGHDGCAYVSRACFEKGEMLPGTFWLDEAGHRHFYLTGEAAEIGSVGLSAGLVQG
jgi:hypothetical protein